MASNPPFLTFKEFAQLLKRSESWLYERYQQSHKNFDPNMPPLREHPCSPRSRVLLTVDVELFIARRMSAEGWHFVDGNPERMPISANKRPSSAAHPSQHEENVKGIAKLDGASMECQKQGVALPEQGNARTPGRALLEKAGDSMMLDGRLIVRPRYPYCDYLMEDRTVIWYGEEPSGSSTDNTGEQDGEQSIPWR